MLEAKKSSRQLLEKCGKHNIQLIKEANNQVKKIKGAAFSFECEYRGEQMHTALSEANSEVMTDAFKRAVLNLEAKIGQSKHELSQLTDKIGILEWK